MDPDEKNTDPRHEDFALAKTEQEPQAQDLAADPAEQKDEPPSEPEPEPQPVKEPAKKPTPPGKVTPLKGKGSLEKILKIFNTIYLEKRTGVFVLRSKNMRRDLYIYQGRLQDVRSDPFNPAECLGRMLQRAGIVEQEDVIESLKKVSADRSIRQGKALIDLKLLDQESLDNALKAQIETKLHPIVLWEEINYDFVDREKLPRGLAMAEVELSWLILQLVWKKYPFKNLRKKYDPYKDKYVGKADDPIYPIEHYGFGEMLEKLWDEILDKDQEWRKLIIISNLKEVQTYRAIWALILTGQLMWLDKPREDTDAIKIEKLKERTKDIEKYNYFERLHVHWSADTEKIEKSWKKTKAEYEKQIKSSTGLEQHFFETMFDLTKTAYDTIKTEKGRKQYRMEIFDEFFLEFNSDIFRQKGEGYLFTKEEYDKAIEELESAIEVWDKEGEYYASLGLALFYKNVFKDAAEAQRAKKMVKKGVSMRPRSEATQICMGMMFKAEGKDRMAMEAFVRALKINPQSGFARAEYEMLKTGKTNKDRDEAIGAFIDRRSDKDKEFDEKFDDLGRRKKRR